MKHQASRVLWMIVFAGLFAPLKAKQGSQTRPTINNAPLTDEQVAVYRAVLKAWSKDPEAPFNLANTTNSVEAFVNSTCGKEFDLKNADKSVHHLDSRVAINPKVVFVDPDQQAQIIKQNDPQNSIRSAIDDHGSISDEQLGRSVTQAFNSGLFRRSEIIFDKQHRRALVAYSFSCGMLCGHGNTLVLKKVTNNWKVGKRCDGWIS